MSPVIATLAWPKTSDTTLSGTPADNITEAAECRSACSPTEEGSVARLAAALRRVARYEDRRARRARL